MWICHRSNRRNLNVNAVANDDSFASDTNKEELLIWKTKMWNMPLSEENTKMNPGTLCNVLCNYYRLSIIDYRLSIVSNQCDLLCFYFTLSFQRSTLSSIQRHMFYHHCFTPCDYPRKHWHFNDFKATHLNQSTRTSETIFESDKTFTMELCLKLSARENGWLKAFPFTRFLKKEPSLRGNFWIKAVTARLFLKKNSRKALLFSLLERTYWLIWL